MKQRIKWLFAIAVAFLTVSAIVFAGIRTEVAAPATIQKTGQTGCWNSSGASISCLNTGQDGEYQTGILPAVAPTRTSSYTVQRFTDNSDGTVKDNLTGLIWLKNANKFAERTWTEALSDCNALAADGSTLTDGSSAGDWRLPNFNELRSLVNPSQSNPSLTSGHPFTGVQSDGYWSSTTYVSGNKLLAWVVYMDKGNVFYYYKDYNKYIWPVRSDN